MDTGGRSGKRKKATDKPAKRKPADGVLRASEERTRSIIESIPVGMHMYCLEADGRLIFTDGNPAADRILGVDNRIFVGKEIEEAFPSLVGTEVPQRYREVIATGIPWQTEQIEYQDNKISGAFEVHAFKTGPDTMAAAFSEITERKRSEATLRESEAKFRRLYNETPVLMHSIDRNGVVVDVNDHWLATMGYERNEVIGRKVVDFYSEESRRYAQEVVQPAFFREGFAQDISYQFVRKNGELIDVLLSASAERDAEGRVVRSQAVSVDVTEKKRTEEALLASEERFRILADAAFEAIAITEQGRFLDANRQMCELIGYSLEELRGKPVADIIAPEDRELVRHNQSIGYELPYENRLLHRDGSVITVESRARHFMLHGRRVRVTVLRDVTEKKRAEKALRESEERFRHLVEQSPIAITIIGKGGIIEYVNKRHKEIVGYAVEEVPNLEAWWRQVYPDEETRQRAISAWQDIAVRVLSDEDVGSVERKILCKDRTTKDVEMRFSRIGDKILAVFTDITERKRAEEEVRLNEMRANSLYRISQHPVRDEQAFIDLVLKEAIALTGSAIGYAYSYDEAKREFTLNSYSRDVMRECSIAERKTCYELDHTGIWGEAVRQRRPILLNDFEADHPLKKGYPEGHARLQKFLTVPVIMEGAVVAVVGVANKQADYTDSDVMQLNLLMDSAWKMIQRARAVRALKQSEERFRDLAESLPLTVFEMDATGRFTFVNRAALETFGYTQQDIDAGLNVMQVVKQQDHSRVLEDIARLLSGMGLLVSEYLAVRKDGSVFPISAASGPIYYEGHPTGIRGIVTDLTERKELEEERLKAQKLESIGTLAGGIAHDFNNLLQGIFGYISMAKVALTRKEDATAMLKQAEEALHLTVNLTTQLLTFSKGGKPLKKLLRIRPVVENAVKFALSGSRTDYRLEGDADLWPVEADAGQLAQVIQNIVLNANESMAGRGMISVSLNNVYVPEGTYPKLPEGGHFVRIAVLDSGIGIPAKDLTRIFDPYFTTKQRGSGLGLATSYSIIRNHGGTIDAESQVNMGSTFTIFLPAMKDATVPEETTAGAPDTARTGRVLIMDDETIVRSVAAEMLRNIGLEVETAADGGEALEMFRQSREAGNPFDLVILDLTVKGGMGGEEAIRRIREIDPAVVAVVSSGYADSPIVADYRAYGFAAVLSKPYTITGLKDCLFPLLGQP